MMNLKKFTVDNANYTLAGDRINFPLDHQDLCKHCQKNLNEHKSDCLNIKKLLWNK